MHTGNDQVVVVDAVRTPIGRAFNGALSTLRADELAAFVVDRLLERNPAVDPGEVEDLLCGCGLPQGRQAFNIGRIVVLLSEHLPLSAGGVTISRHCASSLTAIRLAAQAIEAGAGDVYIAAGVECVSNYNERQEAFAGTAEVRSGGVLGDQNPRLQGEGGRPHGYLMMGLTAENVADLHGVSRAAMDELAHRSHRLAVASQQAGFFAREVVPVPVGGGAAAERDEGPRENSCLDRLGGLPARFKPDGRVTSGNSSGLFDGAAATLLMSARRARELGVTPRARIVGGANAALDPSIMGVAAGQAIAKLLRRTGMTIADMDIVELEEAFASQVLAVADELDVPMERLNPHGGGLALGHPFGMVGARLMATLVNELEWDDRSVGLAATSAHGGLAEAIVVERWS